MEDRHTEAVRAGIVLLVTLVGIQQGYDPGPFLLAAGLMLAAVYLEARSWASGDLAD